ncbi:uncharacterized protein LOC127662810 isoform X2 [Xyrauchen texanus]|uniref:uncharacterized protein LOC127662810 isoform X2 n=1 Tax=Xyrauchen texanus TaxID=154827 RepID=UPI0022419593|nr:uncharacterized protein LOC127662810 isoform X2 [Xyrauchen texanus]
MSGVFDAMHCIHDVSPLLQTDCEKVHFVISLLSGKARQWATALWAVESPLLLSYSQFCHQIAVVFDHPAAGRDVGSRLMFLKQASRTAAAYALDFCTLAAGSGWSDPALLTVYRLGLNDRLQMELDSCQLCPRHTLSRSQVRTSVFLNITQKQVCLPVTLTFNDVSFSTPALVDSVAAGNFLEGGLVQELSIPLCPVVPPLRVNSLDGAPLGSGLITLRTMPLSLQVGLFHTEDLDRLTVEWPEIRGLRSHRETYEDTEDDCNSHLTALTSRLQSQINLQLCFINNSESEEEEEEMEAKKESSKNGSRQRTEKQQGSSCSSTKKDKSGGFKNDVRAALSVLRHKLRLEQKQTVPPSEAVRERKHFKQSDLKNLSLKELKALRSSLSKDIHDLSSELVGRLLTRDQLRTEQDALLLECWNRGVSQVSGFIHTETLSKKGLCLS